MTRQRLERVMLAVVMTAAATAAHGQPPPQPRSPINGTLEFMGAEIPLGSVVRGAPFSGEGVTTISQTLGDGTRIERRVTAKVYRDSDGRIRREQTVLGLDVLKPSADGQPIVITDERWESTDLKVLVSSQHHDPRTGDVEYRLTNISRAEPAAHLFTVPADYDVVEAPPPPPPPPP